MTMASNEQQQQQQLHNSKQLYPIHQFRKKHRHYHRRQLNKRKNASPRLRPISISSHLVVVVVLLLFTTLTTIVNPHSNTFPPTAEAAEAGSAEHIPQPPNYYDKLRTDPTVIKEASPEGSVSNVIKFTTQQQTTYRLADIASFLAYTTSIYIPDNDNNNDDNEEDSGQPTFGDGDEEALKDYISRDSIKEDAVAALIAIDLFNNGKLTTVLQNLHPKVWERYNQCNVRLTTEFHDTKLSPIEATKTLTRVLDRSKEEDALAKATPRPAGVLGSYRDSSTSPLAILSGVHNVSQIGYAASSSDLDIKSQFPLYSRSVPSSTMGDARAIVDYLTSHNITRLGVLFVTDGFGSAYQKALQDAAGEADPPIMTNSHSFSYSSLAISVPEDEVEDEEVLVGDDFGFGIFGNGTAGNGTVGGDFNNRRHRRDRDRERRLHDRRVEFNINSQGQQSEVSVDDTEISSALSALKATQYRFFLAIVAEEHFPLVMNEATKQGLVGKDYVWMFTSGIDLRTFQRNAKFKPGSTLAKATNGIGLLHSEATKTTRHIQPPTLVNRYTQPKLPPISNPPSSYDNFNSVWYDYVKNKDTAEYFISKQPNQALELDDDRSITEFFTTHPNHHSYFIFDSVITLGLSMCMSDEDFFTGKNILDELSSVTFDGATGNISYDTESFSREAETVTYTIWNMRYADKLDEIGNAVYDLVPAAHYTPGEEWEVVGGENAFRFYDNTTDRPPFLPPVKMSYNYIGDSSRIVGYVLLAIVCALAVAFLVWMVWFRATRVIRASKISFLVMVTAGCIVMACAIIPMGLEETIASKDRLDAACMLQLWLFFMGLILAFAALLAKTRAIAKVLKDPNMDIISIDIKDLFLCWLVLFILNFIILITWTTVSPLEWTRVNKDSKDIFDRYVESYGKCSGDNSTAFFVCILVLNIGLLIYANWLSYKTRNIQTEYHESRYISISMASMLQALCMGIPIVIVVKDTPKARYFVMAGIIFVMCCAILLLLFVPKIIAVRNDEKEEKKRMRSSRLKAYSQRRLHNQYDDAQEEDNMEDDNIEVRSPDGATQIVFEEGVAVNTRDDSIVTTNPQDPESATRIAGTYMSGDSNGAAKTSDTVTTVVSGNNENMNAASMVDNDVPSSDLECGEASLELSAESDKGSEKVGIRVLGHPMQEQILKQKLVEAQLENERLQNENKMYEDELNNLLKESKGKGNSDSD